MSHNYSTRTSFNSVRPLRMCCRLAIVSLALILQSCAEPEVSANPPQPPEPVIATLPSPAIKDVVILVSENIPAYSKVAKMLAKQLAGHGSIRYLNASQFENIKMLAAYKDDGNKQFVSIGLNATLAAKTLTNRQVVFCQVFNYQDYDLLDRKSTR